MNNSSRAAWAASVLAIASACGPAGDHPGLEVSPQSEGQALCASGATLQGVDVSSYQGSINWGQAAGGGFKNSVLFARRQRLPAGAGRG